MEINLKSNIKQFTKDLARWKKKQVPFATSLALNETAKDAQDSIIKRIQGIFDNKKKWYSKNVRRTGVRVQFSNKRKLIAAVYSNAPFAEIQEEGGTKTPRGKVLAIPTSQTPKKYKKAGGAKKILETQKTFSTSKGIFRRRGKNQLQAMFTYAKVAHVKPALGFEDTARKVVERRFKKHFGRSLARAIATRKL